MLALTIAAHVAAGARWCGLDAEHGPAVFVSLEDPAAMVRYRLRRIVPAYGLNPAAIAANLRVLDGADCDAALMREVSEYGTRRLVETAAMKALRERVTDARLIVVDNASDAFDGNENERRAVRRFVRMLAQHARSAGAGVLLLAHIDKVAARYGGAGNSYSGCFRTREMGYPTDLPSNVILYMDPDTPWGYVQNWHFTIQRTLFKDTLLDLAYVGNRADHLPVLNAPPIDRLVVDGNLITVRGWPDNGPWMREFVRVLKGRGANHEGAR